MPQGLQNHSILNLLTLFHPFLLMETPIRALTSFPLSLCLLTNPRASLCDPLWCGMPPSFEFCDSNKLPFKYQLSPDLLALLLIIIKLIF